MIYGTRPGGMLSTAPGYNMGGYYTGYSGYYNPYAYQNEYYRRMQEAKKQQEEQAKIFNRMVEINKKSLQQSVNNKTKSEEEIKLEQLKSKMYRKLGMHSRLENQCSTINMHQQKQEIANINRINAISNYNQSKLNNINSLYDFMDNGYILLLDIANQKQKHQLRQVDKLYNKGSYRQLLTSAQAGNNMFNRGPVSVDDMEVALPSSATEEYRNRRAAFINSIMST